MASDATTYSATDLRDMFGYRNALEVSTLLQQHAVEPFRYAKNTGTRRVPEWRIRDAAPILCKLTPEQISEKIRLMHKSQLPPGLTQAYWMGEAARLKVQEVERNLWPTEKIQEVFSGALKALRIGLMLIPDRVMQVNGLSHEQRNTIQDLINNALLDLKRRIEGFLEESKSDAPRAGKADVFGEAEPEDDDI